MKILQYNIQSFVCCCLIRIFFRQKGKANKLINFNIVRKFRPDGYCGVAIGLRKHIRFVRIKYYTNSVVIMIRTTNLKHNVNIISGYFPPSMSLKDFKSETTRITFYC